MSPQCGCSKRVLVLGATGTVGSMVARLLLQQGSEVVAASRRPEAGVLPGASWVSFDYEVPGTFAAAVAGVESIFMVVRPGDDVPQATAIPLLEEASRAGVGKVVLLSAMGAERRPEFGLRILERFIEERGFRFVHLRPNWFMQLFTAGPLHYDLMTTGALHLPAGDAAISYIDAADIAKVAARVLTSAEYDGQGLTLTGPEAMTHEQLTSELSALTARRFGYVALSEDQARSGLALAGFSEARIERLIQFYRLVRTGACAPTSDATQRVTGEPATTWRTFVEKSAAVWS